MKENLTDKELNHICWLIVESVSSSNPIERENEESIEELNITSDQRDAYRAGNVEGLAHIANMLYNYDIEVYEKACEYSKEGIEISEEEFLSYI